GSRHSRGRQLASDYCAQRAAGSDRRVRGSGCGLPCQASTAGGINRVGSNQPATRGGAPRRSVAPPLPLRKNASDVTKVTWRSPAKGGILDSPATDLVIVPGKVRPSYG